MHRPLRPTVMATRPLAVAAILWLIAPRASRAETTVSYKYQDYQESAGRVGVQAQYGLVEQSLGTDVKLKLTGVIDTIAGATPTGEAPTLATDPVPLSEMHDKRKAWTLDYTQQHKRGSFTLGIAESRESDYLSRGASLNTLTDFNQKNTSLLAGLNITADTIRVFYQTPREDKHSWDAVVGVNQIIDRNTSLSVNLTTGHVSGYQSDPYKIISKDTELLPGLFLPLTFPENRPQSRNKWILFTGLNRTVPSADAAIDASYRLYHDTFGVTSHTLSAAWLQKIGSHVILIPSFRFYQQSAADFYHVTLTGTSIVPTDNPRDARANYSADYRLSEFRATTLGLKLVWNPNDHVRVDLAYDRYKMDGRDGLTSASAFPTANTVTAGISFTW